MDAIVSWILGAVNAVGGWMGASAIVAVVIEFVARLVPSVNPKSLIGGIAKLLHAVASLADTVAKFLDAILPQVLKAKPEEK